MESTDVVIAGSGPTGLMLACELRLAGVAVVLLDALPERTGESRAGGIHARTMETFDQRGLLDRLLRHGRQVQAGHFPGLSMSFHDFDTRYPYLLGIVQADIERELDGYAAEWGTSVRWNSRLVDFRQENTGVEVVVDEPGGQNRIRAAYLVGCDGSRSAVRRLAHIDFPGTSATMTGMLADVKLADPPEEAVLGRRSGAGEFSVFELQPGWFRLLAQRHDSVPDRDTPLRYADFHAQFTELAGTDYGMHSPQMVSGFTDAARQAEHYRDRRVFLAGDAAHIHYPAGGQGLNLGVQDAVNLGWKLASVLHGNASDSLLDTYQSERHSVGARVLHNTRAQTALARHGPHSAALREIVSGLLDIDAARRRLGLMITALDIRYEVDCEHPLAGRRVPDADLTTAAGDTRVHELLRSGRAVLLTLDGNGTPESRWNNAEVDIVEARSHSSHWMIPDIGPVPTPTTVLIRPDGYVTWAADSTDNVPHTAPRIST